MAATRGVVRITSIPEENLAFNGTTVFGQIENLQKSSPNKDNFSDVASLSGIRSAMQSRAASRVQSRRQSISKPPSRDGYSFYPTTRPPSPHLRGPPIPTLPNGNNAMDRRAEKAQKGGKRRRFCGFFVRGHGAFVFSFGQGSSGVFGMGWDLWDMQVCRTTSTHLGGT